MGTGVKWLSGREATERLCGGRLPGNITPIGAKVFLLGDNDSYIFLANELLVRYYLERQGATFVTRLLADWLPKPARKVYSGLIDYLNQTENIMQNIRENFLSVREDVANFLYDRRHKLETADTYGLDNGDTPVFWFWVEAGETVYGGINGCYALIQDYASNQFKIHDFLFGLLRALTLAKAVGLLVMDLKPSNLIISVRDGNTIVILNDFDSSVIVSHEKPFFDVRNSRTWEYAAPEQLFDPRGERDQGIKSFSTDLFAAGLIFYEFLDFGNQPEGWGDVTGITGKNAAEREAERCAAFRDKINIRPPRNGSPSLKKAVMKALSLNPAERGNVQALMDALTKPEDVPAGEQLNHITGRLDGLRTELAQLESAAGGNNMTVNNNQSEIKKQVNIEKQVNHYHGDTPPQTGNTKTEETKQKKAHEKTERQKQVQDTIRLCVIVGCIAVCLAFVLLFLSKPASADSISAENLLSVSAEAEGM